MSASIRYTLCAGLILGSVTLPAIAKADLDIDVTTAPPAPQVEVVPTPRTGYVWTSGYWAWNNDLGHYEWIKGHWVEERTGEHWVPDKWTQDADHPNHWHFKPGHWEQD